jgi:hypothetical protein
VFALFHPQLHEAQSFLAPSATLQTPPSSHQCVDERLDPIPVESFGDLRQRSRIKLRRDGLDADQFEHVPMFQGLRGPNIGNPETMSGKREGYDPSKVSAMPFHRRNLAG